MKLLLWQAADKKIMSEAKKTLFIRNHPSKSAPKGELEVGWNFADDSGEIDLPFGAIGLGEGIDDQNARLEKYIADLRVQQKSIGNDSDFGIDDRR